ncbi:MAG: class I SAM-dependent methyltransferase [bacterium]|nr:class I SAM-dependent methyltransferase [bacterium]
MDILWLIILAIILIFGTVVFFGAPYLPTLKGQTKVALDLLDLKAGETLLELGSGDGRLLRAAAEKGVYSIGIELNLLLVIYSKLRHWRYRRFIKVRWNNFWIHQLPETDGIYVFLHTRFMQKLDNKVTQEITQPVKLVSFAFKIPDKTSITSKKGMFLYEYKPLAQK